MLLKQDTRWKQTPGVCQQKGQLKPGHRAPLVSRPSMTGRPAPGWLCWGSGWDLRVRGSGRAWIKGLLAFPWYPRHLSGRPRPRPDPFLPPTWVQHLDSVVGQVQDAQVSQGLQVLHSADAVASQGEEPAEHRGGQWHEAEGDTMAPRVRASMALGCQGLQLKFPWLCQGKKGALCSSDQESDLPGGRSCPYRRLGKQSRFSIFSIWF